MHARKWYSIRTKKRQLRHSFVVTAVATTFNVCFFSILDQLLAAAANNQKEICIVFLTVDI
jgi:hypothetical protein